MTHNFKLVNHLNEEALSASNVPAYMQHITQVPRPDAQQPDPIEEETLQLVRRIFLSADKDNRGQVLFCGVDGDTDSSLVAARVARKLAAQNSQSVCLVDANLRSPRLQTFFGLSAGTALPEPADARRERMGAATGQLWVAGPKILMNHQDALLEPEDLKKRLEELQGMFGHVLIDVAAAEPLSEIQLLGQLSDAVVLVVEANRTRRHLARDTKENLAAAGVRFLGSVLYNRSYPVPEKLYKKL